MSSSISFVCLVFVIGNVIAQDALHPACNAEDTVCVKSSMKSFLQFVAVGIPQFDVKPLDPIVLPPITYKRLDYDVNYVFENTTVTGMKNLTMIDYNINTTEKSVLLRTEADLHFSVHVTVVYNTLNKSFSGLYTGHGKAIMTVSYPYGTYRSEKGTEHFVVKDEVIDCDPIESSGQFEDSIEKDMNSDPEVSAIRNKLFDKDGKSKTMQTDFCTMAKIIYGVLVHDIRAAANVLPKEKFFNNI